MMNRSAMSIAFAGALLANVDQVGAQVPGPSVATGGRGTSSGCSAAVEAWWRDLGSGGRIACAADPTRPAILLVHGNHQNMTTWTAPSNVGYAYDVAHTPADRRVGEYEVPNAGVYKVGKSDWLYGLDRAAWDREKNWFDFLRSQGFTVATWSQGDGLVSKAMRSALPAFDSLLAHTAARSPGAPPPIALIAHSRGGLIVRQILKDRGATRRPKWVVTLHAPHHGSELGKWPDRVVSEVLELMDSFAPATLTAPLKQELKQVASEAIRAGSLDKPENAELVPDGPLLRGLAAGESAVPGVTYYTFGGVRPTMFRMYAWMFDASSAVPQYRCSRGSCKQYFVWRVKAQELVSVSPILDKVRAFVPEVKLGYGDALVTDASARLPWSSHTTTQLNHAEVLWDRPLQERVARLLVSDGRPPRSILSAEPNRRAP